MEFGSISLDDKEIVSGYLTKYPPRISELSFTNLYGWSESKKYEIVEYKDHLLVRFNGKFLLQPTGHQPHVIIREIIDQMPDHQFVRIDEEIAKQTGLEYQPDRDNSDYVHDIAELRTLPGTKYAPKRNFVHRFAKLEPRTVPISGTNCIECCHFIDKWARSKTGIKGVGLEMYAAKKILMNLSDLDAIGITVMVGSEIAGVAVGEKLNNDTFVDHIEKGDIKFAGIYQYLNYELANAAPSQYKYMNREQDMGVPGLRKAKESYHPVILINKCSISSGKPL